MPGLEIPRDGGLGYEKIDVMEQRRVESPLCQMVVFISNLWNQIFMDVSSKSSRYWLSLVLWTYLGLCLWYMIKMIQRISFLGNEGGRRIPYRDCKMSILVDPWFILGDSKTKVLLHIWKYPSESNLTWEVFLTRISYVSVHVRYFIWLFCFPLSTSINTSNRKFEVLTRVS